MPALQSVLGTWCSLLCLPQNSSTQCDHTDGGLCHQEVTQELGLFSILFPSQMELLQSAP